MDKNLPVNAGDMGLILDPGRLHMQLSPQCQNYWSPQALEPHTATTEAHRPTACALQ